MYRLLHDARQEALTARESGVALVMALGIMLVGAVLLTTLAVVTMYNLEKTSVTRIEMRALASADAGIDLYMQMLEGKSYEELVGVCSTSGLLLNGGTVDVTTAYEVLRGGVTTSVACPLATDVTLNLTLTSTATMQPSGLSGDVVTETVIAKLAPTPPEVQLEKAVFSEGSTTITNNSKFYASGATDDDGNALKDAHIYSNADVTCMTQVIGQGSIYAAQGNIKLENLCTIENTVWAAGKVDMTSSARVLGDVYAASSQPLVWQNASQLNAAAVWLSNSATVTGSVVTNGGVYSSTNAGSGVSGNVVSLFGDIALNNQATIGGSAYAGKGVELAQGTVKRDVIAGVQNPNPNGTDNRITSSNNGSFVQGVARASGSISNKVVVSGSSVPNKVEKQPTSFPTAATANLPMKLPPSLGYPTQIQAPAREGMPKITMNDDDLDLWISQGYDVVRVTESNKCVYNSSNNGPLAIINGTDAAYPATTAPRVIIWENCSGPVTFQNSATINLTASVALVSKTGFAVSNNFDVNTNSTGDKYQMHWIVPADAPGATWTPVGGNQFTPSCVPPAGNITFYNQLRISSVLTFMYTPCNMIQANGWPEKVIGQVYAGNVTTANAFELQMAKVPVPSLTEKAPDPTDLADMRLISRYDQHG